MVGGDFAYAPVARVLAQPDECDLVDRFRAKDGRGYPASRRRDGERVVGIPAREDGENTVGKGWDGQGSNSRRVCRSGYFPPHSRMLAVQHNHTPHAMS